MAPLDPYQLLGVNRNASDEDIKKAYHKLARIWHPDKNKAKDADEKFKQLSAAFETIKDKDKRKLYDLQQSDDVTGSSRPSDASFRTFAQRPSYHWSTTNGGGQSGTPSGSSSNFRMFGFPGGINVSFTTFGNDDFDLFFNGERVPSFGNARTANSNNTRTGQEQRGVPPWDFFGPTSPFTDDFPFSARMTSSFDDFFLDHMRDMNQLFGSVFGNFGFMNMGGTNFGGPQQQQRRAERNTSNNNSSSTAGQQQQRQQQRQQQQKKKKDSSQKMSDENWGEFADMYDWSTSPRKSKKQDGGLSDDDDSDDVSHLQFPCMFCGKKLPSAVVNAHEQTCKKTYRNNNSTAAGNNSNNHQTSNNNDATRSNSNSSYNSNDTTRTTRPSNRQKDTETNSNVGYGDSPRHSYGTSPAGDRTGFNEPPLRRSGNGVTITTGSNRGFTSGLNNQSGVRYRKPEQEQDYDNDDVMDRSGSYSAENRGSNNAGEGNQSAGFKQGNMKDNKNGNYASCPTCGRLYSSAALANHVVMCEAGKFRSHITIPAPRSRRASHRAEEGDHDSDDEQIGAAQPDLYNRGRTRLTTTEQPDVLYNRGRTRLTTTSGRNFVPSSSNHPRSTSESFRVPSNKSSDRLADVLSQHRPSAGGGHNLRPRPTVSGSRPSAGLGIGGTTRSTAQGSRGATNGRLPEGRVYGKPAAASKVPYFGHERDEDGQYGGRHQFATRY